MKFPSLRANAPRATIEPALGALSLAPAEPPRPASSPASAPAAKASLSTAYVHTVRLQGLADVFDAQDLWGYAIPLAMGRAPRLREVLEPRSPGVWQRLLRGDKAAAGPAFAQVELYLPAEEVLHDRRVGRGARAGALCEALEALHAKDLGRHLGGGKAVIRYTVRPSDDLPRGTVLARFGHAVHVKPRAQAEPVAYTVQASRDGGVIWEPLAEVMQDQRLVVLGGRRDVATEPWAHWPFGAEAMLVLCNEPEAAMLEVAAEPAGALRCTPAATAGRFMVEGRGPEGGRQVLHLWAQRMLPLLAAVQSDPVKVADPAGATKPDVADLSAGLERASKPIGTSLQKLGEGKCVARDSGPNGGDALDAPTSADDDCTWMAARPPRPVPTLSLAGLLLQRVSPYREHGITALSVGLSDSLAIAHPRGADCFMTLRVDAKDELTVATHAGVRKVSLPAEFAPTAGETIRLVAPPEGTEAQYVAMVTGPWSACAGLPGEGELTVGRKADRLAGLRVLHEQALLERDGHRPVQGADRMGLSGHAFDLSVAPDGMLQVKGLSAHQALFHLDASLKVRAHLAGTDEGATAVLAAGDHLAVGHYLWRYDGLPG